ncbi:MAG: hypothetical protein HC919_03120 [Oscillatoriales cyanobacterium SM2_2_1]|nr:hypothetical protein [Oscillatoriales cyanobacterium SM2_2_1]
MWQGNIFRQWQLYAPGAGAIAFHRNQQSLWVALQKGGLARYAIASEEMIRPVTTPPLRSLLLSPDGITLAGYDRQGQGYLLDSSSGDIRHRSPPPAKDFLPWPLTPATAWPVAAVGNNLSASGSLVGALRLKNYRRIFLPRPNIAINNLARTGCRGEIPGWGRSPQTPFSLDVRTYPNIAIFTSLSDNPTATSRRPHSEMSQFLCRGLTAKRLSLFCGGSRSFTPH